MDIEEIRTEIARLEQDDTNWQNIQKLSWLYIVNEHLGAERVIKLNTDVMPDYAGEFGEVVSGRNIDGIMNVLQEHMAVVKVLHPKEYQAVLNRIAEIP